ncbi:hypothetical protein G6F60_004365 [Rhizopus arrhizus]|nr:hypothetical protein G6F66_002732 [Rhizopus arrhizus]KAG1404403.1 hypothetical protein G6F60_004365 [Rhizopus arrhizus]
MKRVNSFLFALFVCVGLSFAQIDSKKDRLISLVNKEGLIKLNTSSFNQFTGGKRNYGFVAFLTALNPEFNCKPCHELEPEVILIAKTYQKRKDNTNIFFGYLDFDDGEEIYHKLGLVSAPNVLYFPPQKAGESKQFFKYDITKNGFLAENLARFLSEQTGYSVRVNRPINYHVLAGQVALGIGILVSLKLIYRNFYQTTTWATVSILVVLATTSGHMWNHIRGPDYIKRTPSGAIDYVVDNVSSQIGIETLIVAIIYGSLGLSLFSLIKIIPQFEGKHQQNFGVFLCWLSL